MLRLDGQVEKYETKSLEIIKTNDPKAKDGIMWIVRDLVTDGEKIIGWGTPLYGYGSVT